MFRYQPPKSSIWGHALRKMPAARARHLLQQFLDTAAAKYCFFGGALSFMGNDYVLDFEKLLGISSQHSAFHNLTEQQCELVVQEVAKDEELTGQKARSCVFIQSYTISSWKLPEQKVDTPSQVSMYYGQGQFLSTFLQFATIKDFHHIQRILVDLGLCKLNEKHLKTVKERKAKTSSGGR